MSETGDGPPSTGDERHSPSASPSTVLDRVRAESGDVVLRPWRLTPQRLAAYLAAVRAIGASGSVGSGEDPGAVLDSDRNPDLRAWELGRAPGAQTEEWQRSIASEVAARPVLARAVTAHLPLDEFVASHLKLLVCARALILLGGEYANQLSASSIETWAAHAGYTSEPEADFVFSLATTTDHRGAIDAAFA